MGVYIYKYYNIILYSYNIYILYIYNIYSYYIYAYYIFIIYIVIIYIYTYYIFIIYIYIVIYIYICVDRACRFYGRVTAQTLALGIAFLGICSHKEKVGWKGDRKGNITRKRREKIRSRTTSLGNRKLTGSLEYIFIY